MAQILQLDLEESQIILRNLKKSIKIEKNLWKSRKNRRLKLLFQIKSTMRCQECCEFHTIANERRVNFTRIFGNLWKSLEIFGNLWKCWRISKNRLLNGKTQSSLFCVGADERKTEQWRELRHERRWLRSESSQNETSIEQPRHAMRRWNRHGGQQREMRRRRRFQRSNRR